ncbi:urease accessory protein UreF [Pararhodobacter aggregans]|uniref:Urease accessory protein UreF n=1 Tax=Pararhodobacter aggregans TaxID=404875 RepID=A0A2T7UR46_9RHOB|nr:urease accessory UreF family protein [Pararhodobacter aggregans]PTX01940.1 urease accessory protein [Pararhodobacter aggregans]PVE47126.1 urease accessory protein UreF [Pararhodobacter aggregans]
MADPAALLTLTQWLSPAFPTGAFAYSHGLERVVAEGKITDAATLQTWLEGILSHGAGWQDAVLLAVGLRDGADLAALDALARALAPSAERLRETLDQGQAFARTVGALTGQTLAPRPLPVALAEALGNTALALPPALVIALYLQAFTGNLTTIAVRHVPLGQTEGQRVLARLAPLLTALAARAAGATLDDLGGAALAAELAAFEHETQDIRIFRT